MSATTEGTQAIPPPGTIQREAGAHYSPDGQGARREAALHALLDFHRLMMTRLGGASVREWPPSISAAQVKLLFWLAAAGEQPMGKLAEPFGVTLPTVTTLVDKLVAHGLAVRDHSPADRRLVLVRLSEEGDALAARLRQVSEDAWRRIVDHVPAGELPTVERAARVLLEASREAAGEGLLPPAFCPQPDA